MTDLAALLATVPDGGTLALCPCTYRLDAPLVVSRPVSIIGSPGTVLDYRGASGAAITVAGEGRIAGVTLAGLDIRGPGEGASPLLIDAYDTDALTVTGCRLSGTGYGGVALEGCTDTLIAGNTFDTIYRPGYGYGVMVLNRCDRTTIRGNRFSGKGGEWITASVRRYTTTPPDEWPGEILVESNSFADSVGCACDAHLYCNGPYIIRNNLAVRCAGGLAGLANTERGAIVEGNVSVGGEGIRILNKNHPYAVDSPKIDRVEGNVIDSTKNYAVIVTRSDARIAGNVLRYAAAGPAIWVSVTAPLNGIAVEGNVYGNGIEDRLMDRAANLTACEGNVCIQEEVEP